MSGRDNSRGLETYADDKDTGGPAVYVAWRGDVLAELAPAQAREFARDLMNRAAHADGLGGEWVLAKAGPALIELPACES